MTLSITLNKPLSDAFGVQVFMANVYSSKDIQALKRRGAKDKGIICVWLEFAQQHLLNELIRENFEWIDTSLLFSQKKTVNDLPKNSEITCRFADNADQKAILLVGSNAFKQADFYVGLQPNEKLRQKLKKSWLQTFFQSHQGDALIVAEHKNDIVGFMQLSKNQNQWHIDILAVAKAVQKQGVARCLTVFANQQFGLISTSTNLANIKAIQFYEDCFFQLKQVRHLLIYNYVGK